MAKGLLSFISKVALEIQLCEYFASILAPSSLHFISYNFQGFFSGYQTRLFEKWANEIYEKGDNLVKVREDNTFSTVIEKKNLKIAGKKHYPMMGGKSWSFNRFKNDCDSR